MPKITDENIAVFTDEPLYKQHTHDIILPATRREIWLTLVGLILFVVLVNVGVKLYLNDHTTNRGYWLVRQKWLLLEQLEEPVSWLVVGDSSANQGVIPALLPGAAASGGLNLATVGNFGAVDDVWMLQNYIERFGRPENVLMVHVYDVWPREPDAIMLAQIPIPQQEWSTYSRRVEDLAGLRLVGPHQLGREVQRVLDPHTPMRERSHRQLERRLARRVVQVDTLAVGKGSSPAPARCPAPAPGRIRPPAVSITRKRFFETYSGSLAISGSTSSRAIRGGTFHSGFTITIEMLS